VIREALAMHAIFRAAKVAPENIFVVPDALSPTGQKELGIMVKEAGRQFVATVGALGMPVPEFLERWPAAVRVWRDGTDEERDELVASSETRRNAAEIIGAMLLKLGRHSGARAGKPR
jgi:hypothetical protein